MSDQELRFYCRSSSNPDVHHQVDAELTDQELVLTCTCKAAELGMPCRHIIGVARGDTMILAEPSSADQLQDLAVLHTWLSDTSCREDLGRLDELDQLIKEQKRLKKQIKEKLESGWMRKSWETGDA